MAEQDSEVSEVGTDAVAPEVEGFDFGSDLSGLTVETEGDPGTPATTPTDGTAETPQFNPDNVEWLRVDPESLPSEYRHLSGLARNMQSGVTKAVDSLQAQQQQSAEREQQLLKLLAARTPDESEADPYANLNEAERNAVESIREVVKNEAGGTISAQNQRINQLTQVVSHLVGQNRQQMLQQYNSEAVSLREQYGQDIDRYAEAIKADMQMVNPKTNSPYTMTESYEMRSGNIVDKTIKARQDDLAARNEASGDTFIDSVVEDAQGAQPMNEGELLGAVAKLPGFRSAG